MKKIIQKISLGILLLAATISSAQTAKNWTATDCNGNSHTLFDELDSGKVVIMFFEMGCSSCVTGAKGMEAALPSIISAHPNKYNVYYLDYNSGSTCNDVSSSWITNNNLSTLIPCFADAGKILQPYGSGMPLIVIASGTDHKIFYKGGWDGTNFNKSANEALGHALGVSSNEHILNDVEILQTHEQLFILQKNNNSRKLNINIYDLNGKNVFGEKSFSTLKINTENFIKGVYIANVFSGEKSYIKKIIIL